MDRNTLLQSSRTQYLEVFGQLILIAIRRSYEKLYDKADKSKSSQQQRLFMDARSTLISNEQKFTTQFQSKLDSLLERSFQTAYDTFRPSFFNSKKAATMELMDITAFEDELRIDIITSRFRSEAEEQLRDLNIRIAILFERNDIAERENPFRPYLLTRSLILGVEAMGIEGEMAVVMTDQLAEELLVDVASLYESINEHLSNFGVAAQLQFKPQRMPSDLTNPVGYDAESNLDDADHPESQRDNQSQHARNFSNLQSNQTNSNSAPSQPRVGKIEQLIQMVRSRNIQRMGGAAGSGSGSAEGAFGGAGQGNQRFEGGGFGAANSNGGGATEAVNQLFSQAGSAVSGWLEGAQEVGSTLRKVFFGGAMQAQTGGQAGGAGGYAAGAGGEYGREDGSSGFITISPQLNNALRAPIPSTSEMTGSDGEVRNLIIERRDNLNALAADQHEKMTIDIVAMLFEFILKDHQVPAEVRAQLGRLQFSVLKMALMDSALLTKKSHPARLLVNRIGSISVGLQQIDPTGERISAEICRIVEELLASDSENPELFSKMLDQLDVFIARELLASNAKVENAVKVVVNAEHRSQRFYQASAELETMLTGMLITPYLRRFLVDTWSHVIERVERNSTVDSTRFRLLVPNLLWSILPKVTRDDRSMLLQLIPGLVPVLREGMSLVAWLPEHQQDLLNWLVDAHTTVMRAVATDEAVISLAEVQRHFHQFIYPNEVAPEKAATSESAVSASSQPESAQTAADANPNQSPELPQHPISLNRVLLDEAIKELEAELDQVGLLQDLDATPDAVGLDLLDDPLFGEEGATSSEEGAMSASETLAQYADGEASQPIVGNTTSTASSTPQQASGSDVDETMQSLLNDQLLPLNANGEVDILERLRSGVIVEINLYGQSTRGRLNWISPNSSNLILTMNGQPAPSIVSVRMFRRMLKNERARFVEVAPLFERAVQSLLESADQLDMADAA